MRYLIPFTLMVAISSLNAQTIDSVAIKQVDSLIKVSREMTAKRDFDKALEVNAAAENLALEKLGRESAAYGSCAFNRGRVNDFKGDIPEAEKWYVQSKDIREKTLGREHPDYAKSLNNLALLYLGRGNYEKAEASFLQAKEIQEKTLGRDNPDYASSLNNLALIYKRLGNSEKAEKYYLESKDTWEKTLGRENPSYAQSLNNLAVLYMDRGNYEKAEAYYLQAKEIREKTLGHEHPDYASSLNNLAILYHNLGNYEKAEAFYLESKEIRKKALGREHPDYIGSLNNLGILYTNLGNYEKAEAYYLESKAIREKTLGREHPDYPQSLNNLAILYQVLGNYEKAEAYCLEFKEIQEKTLGRENPDYASSLQNLGLIYRDLSNYEKAEACFLESKKIYEKTIGRKHPDYAWSLNNLAVLYHDLGNYEKAEAYYLESKEIREKTLGREHPDYVQILSNLAILYMDLGNYEKAEAYFLKTKEIYEKTIGREHPHYAKSLNNLAMLYADLGNYEKAETYHLESKEIMEKTIGREHPDYAASLNNLAHLYQDLGNYEKAEAFYLESKEIWEKTLGWEHPDYANSLDGLSSLYEIQSRYAVSTPLLAEALTLSRTRIAGSISFLSERELAQYTASQQSSTAVNAYLLKRTIEQIDILPALSYEQSLFTKGFLMQAAARLQQLTSSSPQAITINNDLKGYHRRIAQQLSLPIAERKGVEELKEKANALEKELARTVAGYAEALRQVKWQDVQLHLKESEVAIEFISFKNDFPKTTDSIMYAALLLKSGDKQPLFIPLFEEKQLTQLLSDNKESNLIAALYASRGVVPINEESFRGLHDLFFKPLAPFLQGTKTIYYSPSGLLHRFNFDAIPIDEKRNLSDQYKLVRLGSTRSLVVPDLTKVDSTDQVLLFGGINYNVDTTSIGSDSIKIDLLSSKDDELLFSYVSRGIKERGRDWGYLPGTEQEINGVSKLFKKSKFKTADFSGKYATEEAFKNIGKSASSPRVLHLSTHGFFFPDPKEKKGNKQLAIDNGQNEPAFKMSDHPMIRSGLILAGGNYAWKEGKPFKEGMEDGILTAYEISQMNLSNTELVVLSACETGLGDIQGNEGVYGLQRAFKIAGAKYLMMSLWQVPDEETKEFMITFYKNWLNRKLSIPDAFRLTQTQMREKYTNPYLWAGFVLVE